MNGSSRADRLGHPIGIDAMVTAHIKNRFTLQIEGPQSADLMPLGSKSIAKASMQEMQFLVGIQL